MATGWRLALGLLRGTPVARLQRSFYAALYARLGDGPPRFMNYGLAPIAPEHAQDIEPFQASLARAVLLGGRAALAREPRVLADIACGRGGALALAASLFPAALPIGIDAQPAALLVARRGGARVAAADGLRLPLAGASIDLLVSIEAMMNLGRGRFLREAARVLTPGGVLAACGSFAGRPSTIVALLTREAAEAGLGVLRIRDLTPGIVAACEADAPRRAALLRSAPRLARRYLAGFAALPGSRIFRAYAEGRRCYYLAVLRRD